MLKYLKNGYTFDGMVKTMNILGYNLSNHAEELINLTLDLIFGVDFENVQLWFFISLSLNLFLL